MACNCARRARFLLQRVFGFSEAGPQDAPVYLLRTKVGFVTYSSEQIQQHHFRIILFTLLARLLLGKPVQQESA